MQAFEPFPPHGLAVVSSPLLPGARIGRELGLEHLWLKVDTRNPTLSFKDRVVAVATARALTFGFDTLACASTGNLAGATAAAAAAVGLRAFVFVPADPGPAKGGRRLAYCWTGLRSNGTIDRLNG